MMSVSKTQYLLFMATIGACFLRASSATNRVIPYGHPPRPKNFTATPFEGTISSRPLDAQSGGSVASVPDIGASSLVVPTTKQSYVGVTDTIDCAVNNGICGQPPDQGLCVSDNWVYEIVNSDLSIYDATTGNLNSRQSLMDFIGVGLLGGSTNCYDPRCVFDNPTKTVFFTIDCLDANFNSYLGSKLAVLAATPTAVDPLALKISNVINQDRSDFPTTGCTDANGNAAACTVSATCNGGTTHCWGDYPRLAVDASFIWSTVDFYTSVGINYVGGIIYAFDKTALLGGLTKQPYIFDSSAYGSILQPAITQFGSNYPSADDGTDVMFFTSSPLCIVAIHQPSALLTGGAPTLSKQTCQLFSEIYIQSSFVPSPGGSIGPIDSRMQQTVFMSGTLWGGVNSQMYVNGALQFGVAYYSLAGLTYLTGSSQPQFTINAYGYLGLTNMSVILPSIAPFPGDITKAVIAVSIVGDVQPLTFGYSILDINAPAFASTIHLLSPPSQSLVDQSRVGDYSAAAVAPDGSVWIAGEAPTNGDWTTWIAQIVLPTSTTLPPPTTQAPTPTTQAPTPTTQAPPVTTQAPTPTTQAPTTTQAPIATTQAPTATTQAPPVTTKAPAVTSQAPPVTTQAPATTAGAVPTPTPIVPQTTAAPIAMTAQPVLTKAPPVTTKMATPLQKKIASVEELIRDVVRPQWPNITEIVKELNLLL